MTWVYRLDHDHGVPLEDVTALVGGKAANLGVMSRDLELPVPPGMAITTAACRAYLSQGWPSGLEDELRQRMAEVEVAVGRRFGDAADPLLVSVRSGAPVSMPGMMDTILNLGLNDATATGLAGATGDEAFARDCQRRFLGMFREIVGAAPPDDPWVQLRLAVEAVFASWNSERARAYRRKEGIPDDAGTGVTIQAMVFGNRGTTSGTGVVFTRNPATGEPGLYGDVMFAAQGEDVVAGTHTTEPIGALDQRLPEVAGELRAHAARLEAHYRDLCDIEFTIDDGRLWLLQVRVGKRSPRAALRIAVDMAQDTAIQLSRREAVERVASLLAVPPRAPSSEHIDAETLVMGLGASPGLGVGEIATSPEDAARAADEGRTPILVRAETSPEDVHGMARAAGILTARGGLASHAAVVARGWGIPAVVGATEIEVADGVVRFPHRTLHAGDLITIDGDTGAVYLGAAAGSSDVVPEARTLLGWAKELGFEIPGGDDGPAEEPTLTPVAAAAAAAPAGGEPTPAITADDAVQALAIKGMAPPESVGHALLSPAAAIGPLLDQLVQDGLAMATAGAYRLTEAGRARGAELLSREQDAFGAERANAALDAFLDLDRRVKEAVTDWQVRSADGSLNDHSDAGYDAAVLERLASIHAEAAAWIDPLGAHWPRAARYGTRLAGAMDRVREGDQRYVASARVDSYHGVWFELHEDLILLAGRTRADEVAAGRA
ncbi:MAG: pyruvate, orthophosphate dikinase [Chloroflexota bacterium]|nr:pyruvate, orthophosphate dikinase [Chloroflexota bacterium]